MSEILKRTSQNEERNVETKNQKPEVEMETEKMIAVNTRLCAKTGLMIKPLENRDRYPMEEEAEETILNNYYVVSSLSSDRYRQNYNFTLLPLFYPHLALKK